MMGTLPSGVYKLKEFYFNYPTILLSLFTAKNTMLETKMQQTLL